MRLVTILLNQCFLLFWNGYNVDLLLLGARDGFILNSMLQIRDKYIPQSIAYKYIYTSRYSSTLAGMITTEDVKYAFSMAFDGRPEEMLRKRFSLEDEDILPLIEGEDKEKYLEKHIPLILERAYVYRKKYQNYLSKEGVSNNKVGFLISFPQELVSYGSKRYSPLRSGRAIIL